MQQKAEDAPTPKGVAFLTEEVGSEEIKTPEKFTEEQQMFAATVEDFMAKEVFPAIDELEEKNFDKMLEILDSAADLGLLRIGIPEEYGGLGVDKTTVMLVMEKVSQYAGFSATYGAQTGIGMEPLIYFGTEEQKQKWLPKLGSGETIGAYALTEPGSGSDALAAQTKAVPVEDGDYYEITGTKMWITNAGFADLFTVFCQVEGDKFTAFLIEADRQGVSTGPEEDRSPADARKVRSNGWHGGMMKRQLGLSSRPAAYRLGLASHAEPAGTVSPRNVSIAHEETLPLELLRGAKIDQVPHPSP